MAGEPIATRWSSDLKEEIKRSRVSTTKRIVEAVNSLGPGERPEVLVNASAVGFYGTSETATFNEESSSGDDYLAEGVSRVGGGGDGRGLPGGGAPDRHRIGQGGGARSRRWFRCSKCLLVGLWGAESSGFPGFTGTMWSG